MQFSKRKDTQILLTSHSPVFYLSGDKTKSGPKKASRSFVLTQQQLGDDKADFDVSPGDAIQRMDSLEEADSAMNEASLMQRPYLIRQLRKFHSEQDKQKVEIDGHKKVLENVAKPTLFIKGKNDLGFVRPRIKAMAGDGLMDVKPLQGTLPVSCFLLFDNDKSGRNSFKNITGINFNEDDALQALTEAISAWCLPASEEFLQFISDTKIPIRNFQFPFEFLFDGEKSANELAKMISTPQLELFESEIPDFYHRMPQEVGNALRSYPHGSKEWLWSRNSPDAFKSDFLNVISKELPTEAVDKVLGKIIECLIPQN